MGKVYDLSAYQWLETLYTWGQSQLDYDLPIVVWTGMTQSSIYHYGKYCVVVTTPINCGERTKGTAFVHGAESNSVNVWCDDVGILFAYVSHAGEVSATFRLSRTSEEHSNPGGAMLL